MYRGESSGFETDDRRVCFIIHPRWRGKIAEIIDSLQRGINIDGSEEFTPRIARHVVGRFMDRFLPSDSRGRNHSEGRDQLIAVFTVRYALSQALRKLIEAGLLTALTPRAPPQPVPLSSGQICTVHTIKGLDMRLIAISSRGGISTDGHCRATDFPALQCLDAFCFDSNVDEVQAPYVDDVHTSDVQYVIRGGRCTHRDALIRALSHIRVETTTTLKGLIHMVTVGRATCIVFSDEDLLPEGLGHTCPIYISVGCLGRQVPSVLLDNNSTLNVCPLAIAIAIGYAPSDFGPST
ncbi:hypothetical protein CK203_050489 [Vitis vinifera]|uniref:Uncharacterized protein n=1 Tax=Vitis vinifera TaxID=29760 RepID=A0A438H1K9_VITVI|nr:hypothetical protein CK203_050489 [Vitis vinifera]